MADPKVGEMILYDYIRPPLLAGDYRMGVRTDVTIPSAGTPLPGQDFYLSVEGPRFALAQTEVAGVFPPRNGHGPFDSALPHIALGRRTLPWERALGDAYTVTGDQTPYPFLALVLLEESECTLLRNQTLTDVVPPAVFQRLGRPQGIRCDAVEADEQLLRDILPMPDELRLLTHVRQVNVDDRELAAGDSDGYFAVVMGNRIPRSGGSYVACLVSVEERTDLLPTTDVVVKFPGAGEYYENAEIAPIAEAYQLAPSALGTQVTATQADVLRTLATGAPKNTSEISFTAIGGGQLGQAAKTTAGVDVAAVGAEVLHPKARLVLLHSWTFMCEGDGTFRQLMQGLDVGMTGDTDPAAKLRVTDTGHTMINVVDRLGAPEQSWYRGPLAGQPLTRDPLGPYHSADQARRVVAETGAENISYAAAFEAGRLLAAADARLAQELMRWRRGSFRAAARDTSITLLRKAMRLTEVVNPLDPVALRYATDVLEKITAGIVAPTDPLGIDLALTSPLLEPDAVAKAFGLRSAEDAAILLGDDPVLAGAVTVRTREWVPRNLDEVMQDRAGMAALTDARARAIDAVRVQGQRLREDQR